MTPGMQISPFCCGHRPSEQFCRCDMVTNTGLAPESPGVSASAKAKGFCCAPLGGKGPQGSGFCAVHMLHTGSRLAWEGPFPLWLSGLCVWVQVRRTRFWQSRGCICRKGESRFCCGETFWSCGKLSTPKSFFSGATGTCEAFLVGRCVGHAKPPLLS